MTTYYIQRFLIFAYYYGSVLLKKITERLTNKISVATSIGNTLCIPYMYDGNKYKVFVPYFPDTDLQYSNIYANMIDGSFNNISQQNGVPYLVNKKMLGAKQILCTTYDDTEVELIDLPQLGH